MPGEENMKIVGHDASLAPSTVENLPPSIKRARKAPQRRVQPPVKVTQVNPLVWAEAMKLAGGDAKKIKVLRPTAVIVDNLK